MSKSKNTKPAPQAQPKDEAQVQPKDEAVTAQEIAGLKVLSNGFKLVDNTHEPSDTKPRTAAKAKAKKITGGMTQVDYL